MTHSDGGSASVTAGEGGPSPLRTTSLLDEQIEILARGDHAALMRRYHPEAVLVRADLVARGRDEVARVLAPLCAARPVVEQVLAVGRSEDSLVYEALQRMDGRRVRTAGSFVLREGVIWRQTALTLREGPP